MIDPEIRKMLQAIIKGQNALHDEMIRRDEKRGKEIKDMEERLTWRLNAIGKTVANIEYDAPTSEDMKNVEKRLKTLEVKVKKLEAQSAN